MAPENRLICSRDTLVIAVFGCLCLLFELDLLHPHERPIPMQVVNLSNGTSVVVKELLLNHTYVPSKQQICPTALLVAFCVLVPLGVLAVISFIAPKPGQAASFLSRDSLHCMFCFWVVIVFRPWVCPNLGLSLSDCTCPRRGYMLTMACTMALTDFIKNYIGYLRPYFYDECGFDPVTRTCLHPKADAHKSFPSGHSSLSFSSMLFTSLFLVGKVAEHPVKINTCLGEQDCTNLGLLIAVTPVLLAFWIAASRVRENDHHPADVAFGAFIGSGWALFWYTRYFLTIWKFEGVSKVPSTETRDDDNDDELSEP